MSVHVISDPTLEPWKRARAQTVMFVAQSNPIVRECFMSDLRLLESAKICILVRGTGPDMRAAFTSPCGHEVTYAACRSRRLA